MTTHTDLAAQVERVELYGVKDGKQTLLGTVPMPPRMRAREITREMFGPFEDDDGSDAELCFAALEQMIEHMGALAALSTERLAGGGEPVGTDVIVDAYAFPSATQFGDEIKVQRTRQIEGPALWKVVDGKGNCLNKSGEWEWEPMPSSRDDEFLSRCRFPTADAAINAARGIGTPKEST